jgi:hypothetical protein
MSPIMLFHRHEFLSWARRPPAKKPAPQNPFTPPLSLFPPSFSIISRPESRNCPRPNANLESDLCRHVQNPAAPPAATPSAASPGAASPSLPSATAPSSPFPPNPSDITAPDPSPRSTGLRHKTSSHPCNPKQRIGLPPSDKYTRLPDFASQRWAAAPSRLPRAASPVRESTPDRRSSSRLCRPYVIKSRSCLPWNAPASSSAD